MGGALEMTKLQMIWDMDYGGSHVGLFVRVEEEREERALQGLLPAPQRCHLSVVL